MLMGVFWRQRFCDSVRASPFFFLRRKKNLEKERAARGCPAAPPPQRYQRGDSVQVAQHGQVKAQIIKRPAARTADERLSPEYRNFLRCAQHLCQLLLPPCPFPGGSRGGGAALSSLCRRFPGGDIMNLTSRRSPLSGLSFSEFFFLRRKKNG